MIFVADQPPKPTTPSPIESIEEESSRSWISREKPDSSKWVDAESEIRTLPVEGGNLLLRLNGPAPLQINYDTRECRVPGWDITVHLSKVHTLPREMARKFLSLFSKAEEDNLDEKEQLDWVNIIEQTDYTNFSIDRAAPQYVEGTILRKTPIFYVEWHDGNKEKLTPKAAASLSSIDEGEAFGAFVKLGRDNKAVSIERISKLAI